MHYSFMIKFIFILHVYGLLFTISANAGSNKIAEWENWLHYNIVEGHGRVKNIGTEFISSKSSWPQEVVTLEESLIPDSFFLQSRWFIRVSSSKINCAPSLSIVSSYFMENLSSQIGLEIGISQLDMQKVFLGVLIGGKLYDKFWIELNPNFSNKEVRLYVSLSFMFDFSFPLGKNFIFSFLQKFI